MAHLDRRRIESLVPHRPPFLFLESAHIVSPSEITGVARWSSGHPILAGHFPGFPLVPGVLIVEAAAQAAAVLVAALRDDARRAVDPPGDKPSSHTPPLQWELGMLTGIRRSSFYKPVFADDALALTVRTGQALGNMMSATAEATLAEQGTAFRGEFNMAVVDRSHINAGLGHD